MMNFLKILLNLFLILVFQKLKDLKLNIQNSTFQFYFILELKELIFLNKILITI